MKRYDIYKLWVIKSWHNDVEYYYICQKIDDFNFIELLTGTKIFINETCYVNRLTNYYPDLVRRNFSTGKNIILSKEDILIKTIEINSNYNFNQDIKRKLGKRKKFI